MRALTISPPNPTGLCLCGCGGTTAIAHKGDSKRGHVRGEYKRFLLGHNMWKGDDVGYVALHLWISRHKEKTGACQKCGREGYTEFANISGEYRRDIEDFIEVCKGCHLEMDGPARCRHPRHRFRRGDLS